MMGGMDDMNAPMPPMDAEQGMPPEGEDPGMPPPPEDDMGGDMGGEDPMPGDPNALSAGSPEVQQFMQDFQNSDPETQDGTMKYFNSQKKDNGGEQPADAGMPPAPGAMPESKFNFKRIIDETFSTIFGDGNQSNFERGTTDRPQTVVGEDALTQLDNPFLPR
jgi:hypothetical protein